MGNGFGHFHAVAVNLYTKNTDHYFYPHNILIEILYAVGILGALFVGAVLLVLVWEVLRSKDKIQPCSPIFAFVVSIGVGSLFGGDYLDFRLVWLGLLLCIMLCENTVSFKFKLPEAVK
jgi:O-antigen ligase